MNRTVPGKVISLLIVVLLLIPVSLVPGHSASAQDGAPNLKVSSSLGLRVKTKGANLLQPAGVMRSAAPADRGAVAEGSDMGQEKVYIYFAERPAAGQLAELTGLGVTVYPDSWIPPVGGHPSGFLLASMPVDKLDALASKDYVARLDTAEQLMEPQNDLGRAAMNVGTVWSSVYTGAGVRVAILDSGLDLTQVRKIVITFEDTGKFAIDDIQFSK